LAAKLRQAFSRLHSGPKEELWVYLGELNKRCPERRHPDGQLAEVGPAAEVGRTGPGPRSASHVREARHTPWATPDPPVPPGVRWHW
jgi:hypothetical protein